MSGRSTRAGERRYLALSEHASDIVSILSLDGTMLYASPSHQRVLGYHPDDLIGTWAFDLVHPDDVHAGLTPFKTALRDKDRLVSARLRLRHAEGGWKIIDFVGRNRLDDPDVRGFIVNGHDVTEYVQAEEALRAERARLELLLESARAFNSTLDRASILHTLTARLVDVLGAAGAVVTDIDHTTQSIHATIRYTAPGRPPMSFTDEWEPLSAYPQFEQVLRSGVPWHGHIDDPDFPPSERSFLERRGMQMELLVPIIAQGRATSVLEVYWDTPAEIGPDTVAVCMAIAEQASLALEKARLYATEAELRRRAEVRARRMEHVQRVGESLKMELDETEIGRHIATAASEALGFQTAVLNLVDEPENPRSPWRVVATLGIPPEGIEVLCDHSFTIADAQALFRPEFRISRSYFIPEESEMVIGGSDVPRWRMPQKDDIGADAWHGGDELLVPLTDSEGGHLVGFLSVNEPKHGRRPEREEIEVLEIFADQAVVALRNAQLLARARREAERDALTGLFNHRAAHTRLETALHAAQQSGDPLGLLAVDMDGFKLINDTYGHHTGDLALRHVAELLERCSRAGDVAARLGGDEFLLVLPGASHDQSVEVAQRLMSLALEAPLCSEGADPIPLRLSVGVAACPDDADRPQALLTIADTRLYEAKRAGGRGVEAGRRAEREAEIADLAGFDMLSALVTAVDNKDRYTREHSEQVAAFARALAEALGLSRETQHTLRLAGLLHDVGKIGVPDRVLRKPGRLTAEEWEAMARHVTLSAMLVRAVGADADVLAAVAHHHERWDGRGYPGGLSGAEVPLLGRIMIVADAVSAMAMDRPYRKSLPREAIQEELRKGAGSQFDPALVPAAIALLSSTHFLAA